jgi:hypothetical protein
LTELCHTSTEANKFFGEIQKDREEQTMKTNIIATTFAIAIVIAAGAGMSLAQDGRGGGRLVGTWDAVVQIKNCQDGSVLNTFASIASFNQGGTSIGSTSGIPQSLRTPEHGIWRHVGGNIYEFKFKSFSFNAMGQPVSYAIVQHQIALNETADAYYSDGTAKFYLLNGTQVGQGCSDALGTRMTF